MIRIDRIRNCLFCTKTTVFKLVQTAHCYSHFRKKIENNNEESLFCKGLCNCKISGNQNFNCHILFWI